MQVYVDVGNIVGVIGFVVCWGKVVYVLLWGYVDCEVKKLMMIDVFFCMYLMIKVVIGVVVMMLYEEQGWLLLVFVSCWIFELGDMKVVVYDVYFEIGVFRYCFVDVWCDIMICDLLIYILGISYVGLCNVQGDFYYQ